MFVACQNLLSNFVISEFYMIERDFGSILAGVEHDENGKIVSANATIMRWMGRMNATRALLEGGKNDAGTGRVSSRILYL